MGIFGFFSSGGSKEDRKIAKLKNKLLNPHRQTDERKWVMEALAELGSEEAVQALLLRFTYRTDAGTVDDDEKNYACHLLQEMGEISLEPIEQYILGQKGVYWPLRAYQAIAGAEKAEDLIHRGLDALRLGYAEEERRKAELISHLREFKTDRAYERLVVSLQDTNDDVRVMAVEALISFGPNKALPGLVERLLDPEESARIRTVIMEVLAESSWSLLKYRARLQNNLMPAYSIGADGRVVRS